MQINKERPSYALDDAELDALIKKLTPKIRINAVVAAIFGFIATAAGVMFTLNFYVFDDMVAALGYGTLAFIAGTVASITGMDMRRHKRKLKYAISDSVVRCALSARFTTIDKFSAISYIKQDTVMLSGLIHRSWNTINGSDLIEGTYRGVNFVFSNLHLEQVTTDNKGNEKRVTKFKGQWLTLSLAKPMTFGVQLRGRKGRTGQSTVETESAEFNSRFQIIAYDAHTAFYVLTPQLIEQIIKADKKASARMLISFDGDKMHAAIDSYRELFEPADKKLFAVSNIATLRMQMKWDVNYIANIIDEFLANEALFNAEGV